MGFPLQGVLLDRDRCPSRGPSLPGVTSRSRAPRRGAGSTWPTSRPFSRDEFVLSPGPQVIPAVDAFLGFYLPESSLVRPGARFGRGASPLALRRLDVQARPGLRVLRCERVERSVSGPSTLLGFSTFRRQRHSVRRSAGRAYRFASRSDTPKRIPTIHAPLSRRSSRSRACCPVPASVVSQSAVSPSAVSQSDQSFRMLESLLSKHTPFLHHFQCRLKHHLISVNKTHRFQNQRSPHKHYHL
jgi:hypothetical protein